MSRAAAGGVLAATAIAACGSGSAGDHTWSNVTRVTILSRTPGIPLPPGTAPPGPVVFSSPSQLKTITAALNDDHIRQGDDHRPSGCAGGTNITIVITQRGDTRTRLGAYRCANRTYGDVAGDLDAFLRKAGVGG